jgi:hypothetical protein
VFAVMSASSAVAGVLVAVRGGWPGHRIGPAGMLTAPFAFATVALALGAQGASVVVAMAVFGLPLAALSALGTSALTARVPDHTRNRALAFFAATITITTGAGFALAAILLAVWGPVGALTASATVFTALTGALSICAAVSARARSARATA